jgi:dynein heavy chain
LLRLACCQNLSYPGAVECWLLDVQGAMKRTMHSITREALAAYPKASRTSWILQWPGQLVLNGSQVWLVAAVSNTFRYICR